MPDLTQHPREIPQPVLDARKALDVLRAEGVEVSPAFEKALPGYALNLSKSGQEVTVDGLLAAARQGEDFLKSPALQSKTQEDPLSAYERITKSFSVPDPYKDKTQEEQFITAARLGDDEKIKLLISYGVDIVVQYNDAIILAAYNGHSDTVRLLIGHGADFTAQGNEAVRMAAMNGYSDTVRLLIEHGADVTAQDNNAIKCAAMNGHSDTVRLLIGHGADFTARDNEAVRWAAEYGHSDTVRLLIEHGADVIAQGNYAIRWAARNGHSDTARLLIEHGADKSALTAEQTKALKAYDKRVSLWQKAVRMDPPLGLHTENPAYFKKACFESIVKMLAKEEYNGRQANAMAFHAAGLFSSENRVLQYLEQRGVAGKQPLHDLVHMIKLPKDKEDSLNLKDWGDAVLKCGPSMAKLVKFADKIPSPVKSSDGRTWSMVNTRAECAKFSFKKAAEHPALAAVCFEHEVDEDAFNEVLKIVQETKVKKKTVPNLVIDGSRFGAEGSTFKRLAADDIRGLFLGEMTDCCQSIGSEGRFLRQARLYLQGQRLLCGRECQRKNRRANMGMAWHTRRNVL